MIGKIQDYKLKEVKVKKDEATVTFTSLSVSFHGAEAAVRTILMSPYGINIDKLKYWNQSDKSNDEMCIRDRHLDKSLKVYLLYV